jgi:hypothetical protein
MRISLTDEIQTQLNEEIIIHFSGCRIQIKMIKRNIKFYPIRKEYIIRQLKETKKKLNIRKQRNNFIGL